MEENYKYVSKQLLNKQAIADFTKEVIFKSYLIVLDVKYSKTLTSGRRVTNHISSIKEFIDNLLSNEAKHVQTDITIRDSHEKYVEAVIDYVNDEGWHFLWCRINDTVKKELIDKYNFKPV